MDNIQLLCCHKNSSLNEVLHIMNSAAKHNLPSGIALVVNGVGQVIGTITDGDIRRAFLAGSVDKLDAGMIMNDNPIYFNKDQGVKDILIELPQKLNERGRKSNRFLSKILLVDDEKRPVRIIEYHELWEQRVATHRHIVVVGLGYVGLTMAVVMADAGFMVSGVEVDETKIKSLRQGLSYIHETGIEELLKKELHKNLYIKKEIPDGGDVYIITVGTPVQEDTMGNKLPVLDYLQNAASEIGLRLNRSNLVILRSTVPIGATRNIVKPILEEKSGLICGLDFHLAFAPERTAEGRALKELRSLPQVIGGFNTESVESAAAVFRDITPTIVRMDSLEEAEMVKLINNSFRDYVFAFSNSMAKIAARFNIDIVDVISAANEGYIRDPVPLPSPGVGGPCLTKDPHIFAYVAESSNIDSSIFINGRYLNESMHFHVVEAVQNALKEVGKDIFSVRILVAGLAFKGYPETGDIRNSSGVEIAKLLQDAGAKITAFDAVAQKEDIEAIGFDVVSIPEGFCGADVVLFLNNHRNFETIDVFNMVLSMNERPIVYDGWKLFRPVDILNTRPSIYLNLSICKNSLV